MTAHYRLSRNEFSIRNEIMTYGPVMTSVMMYDDFLEKPDGKCVQSFISLFFIEYFLKEAKPEIL